MKQVLALVLLAGFLVGGVAAWNYLAQEARHGREIREFQEIVQRLTVETRLAQVSVLDRTTDPDGRVRTTVQFMEWDRQGKPLPPLTCSVVGSEVYFDALVIKFQHEYVEKGESLREHSLVLFRRIFGSSETPESGIPIDSAAEDGVPGVYRVNSSASSFERDLWKRFWYYADHPEESAALGVRVMQSEAVGARLSPGAVYDLSVQANGGINLTRTTPESK